jgi:hypothetical protein
MMNKLKEVFKLTIVTSMLLLPMAAVVPAHVNVRVLMIVLTKVQLKLIPRLHPRTQRKQLTTQ